MSEPQERPYADIEEPDVKEKGIRTETQVPKQEKGEGKRQKKKKTESNRKEGEFSVAGLSKQLEKQTTHLARLEEVLQPLRKLAKASDVQSKVVREINSSVKQMQRQLLEIQRAFQKGKIRRK